MWFCVFQYRRKYKFWKSMSKYVKVLPNLKAHFRSTINRNQTAVAIADILPKQLHIVQNILINTMETLIAEAQPIRNSNIETCYYKVLRNYGNVFTRFYHPNFYVVVYLFFSCIFMASVAFHLSGNS